MLLRLVPLELLTVENRLVPSTQDISASWWSCTQSTPFSAMKTENRWSKKCSDLLAGFHSPNSKSSWWVDRKGNVANYLKYSHRIVIPQVYKAYKAWSLMTNVPALKKGLPFQVSTQIEVPSASKYLFRVTACISIFKIGLQGGPFLQIGNTKKRLSNLGLSPLVFVTGCCFSHLHMRKLFKKLTKEYGLTCYPVSGVMTHEVYCGINHIHHGVQTFTVFTF